MANEVTASMSLMFNDGTNAPDFLQVFEKALTSAGKKFVRTRQTVGITEEALVLGEVTNPLVALIVNIDPTNFVNVKTALGGAIFATLTAGMGMLVPLGPGAQAPAAIADTAPCAVEAFFISA